MNGGRFFGLLRRGDASVYGLYFMLWERPDPREVPEWNIRFLPAHFGKLRPKWTSHH
jgi:hypothetical protein